MCSVHVLSHYKCREIWYIFKLNVDQSSIEKKLLPKAYLFLVSLTNYFYLTITVESDELDSYMYQTVGHHAIDLYAEAMALPLYRRTIRGRSLETGKMYTTREGDEVEDLYELLKLVKVCRETKSPF